MKLGQIAGLSAVLWSMAAAANAQQAQSATQDVRCLLLATHMSGRATKPEVKTVMSMTSAYYLGRVNGRIPDSELEARTRTEAKALVGTNVGQQMQSCVADMQNRARAMQAIGRKLTPEQKPAPTK